MSSDFSSATAVTGPSAPIAAPPPVAAPALALGAGGAEASLAASAVALEPAVPVAVTVAGGDALAAVGGTGRRLDGVPTGPAPLFGAESSLAADIGRALQNNRQRSDQC